MVAIQSILPYGCDALHSKTLNAT